MAKIDEKLLNSWFVIRRGDKNFKVLGSQIKGRCLDGDLFTVQRGDIVYKIAYDGALPWLSNIGVGGVFHITNVTGHDIRVGGYDGRGPYTAWDIDGTNERQIEEVKIGEELVFITGSDGSYVFEANDEGGEDWDFGFYTDTSGLTRTDYMFQNARDFNGVFGGNWDMSNVTTMERMFDICFKMNSDITGWDVSNVKEFREMFGYCYQFNQDIGEWDMSGAESIEYMFYHTDNFNQDISGWDVSNVTNMDSVFNFAKAFNQDISPWDTSKVDLMRGMFQSAETFNQDLSDWCVSLIPTQEARFDEDATDWALRKPCWGHCPRGENGTVDPCPPKPWDEHNGGIWHITNVTSRVKLKSTYTSWLPDGTDEKEISTVQPGEERVFITPNSALNLFKSSNTNAQYEIGPLTNTSEVINMKGLFYNNEKFVGVGMDYIDISNVTNMQEMFYNARAFNHDLGWWDVSNVKIMRGMFQYNKAFNSDVSGWDTSNVTDMGRMFEETSPFNTDVTGWDTSNVENMEGMFRGNKTFNQDISTKQVTVNGKTYTAWDTSNVTDMNHMFRSAEAFNQDIGNWDTSKVENMYVMFRQADVFNQDISGWDVSKVKSMSEMFRMCPAFNRDIGGWDVSNVTNMYSMFSSDNGLRSLFDQDLSGWCVSQFSSEPTDFANGNYVWTKPKPKWGTCP